MYQTGHKIKDVLYKIERQDIVLPAIQREFVWSDQQVCRLFDSLMQGYPFGTFLFWQVEAENSTKFKYYDFVLDYHEKDSPHCPPLPVTQPRPLIAVLDGQQRLTALNIGLRGSVARRRYGGHWKNPNSYIDRRLHLDLLWHTDEDDESVLKYRFEFLTQDQVNNAENGECWFLVSDIIKMDADSTIDWVEDEVSYEKPIQRKARSILRRLYDVVHIQPIIAFYEETDQELAKVLQIFVRMNSGGTPLRYSDLLLSTAVAQWTEVDAREEIHGLVDDLNDINPGFRFTKDLVLKAGLLLSNDEGNVAFRLENFNRENMSLFQNKWNDIQRALMLTVELIASFGFSERSISAHNTILPIAYYLYKRQTGDNYLTSRHFANDRKAVREWLIRALLKSHEWGSSGTRADAFLTDNRQIIKENLEDGNDYFPSERIFAALSLHFSEDERESLADMRFGDRLTFALLSLLFPFIDMNHHFHVDHIFPKAKITNRSLRSAGIPDDNLDEVFQQRDGLANLQLLEGQLNQEKSDHLPAEWLRQIYSDATDRKAYEDRHLLGDVPESITDFDTFYEARRERLKVKITELLGRRPVSVTAAD